MTSELGTNNNNKKGHGITFRFKEAGSGTQAALCWCVIRATPQAHSENHWKNKQHSYLMDLTTGRQATMSGKHQIASKISCCY